MGGAVSEIRCKRVYEPPEPDDGFRMLVDRLWPRGLRRESASIDVWARDLAPSDDLRRWFDHDPSRFAEFRRRYRAELRQKREELGELVDRAGEGPLTLLYAARDAEHNNAVVLAEMLRSL
ncbi:MAG: DUF488 domain-containing protein [Solirubrobacteraceae bacterium]